MHYTATVRAHPPPLAAGVEHFFLDDDEPPAAGSRPDRIAALSGPQERDLRRTVEQIVDAVPLVPLLDDPVPQMVEQLPDVVRFFDLLLPVPEQVIEVPKILLDDVCRVLLGLGGPRDYGVGLVCFFPGKPGEHQCRCWLCWFRGAFSRFDMRA